MQSAILNHSVLAADDVAKLLKEVGVAADKADLDAMIHAVNGKQLHDLINAGSKKLASVPSGGAARPAGAPVAAAAGATAEKKKEEAKKEEEADVDMGGLFGDDYWWRW